MDPRHHSCTPSCPSHHRPPPPTLRASVEALFASKRHEMEVLDARAAMQLRSLELLAGDTGLPAPWRVARVADMLATFTALAAERKALNATIESLAMALAAHAH